MSPLAHEPDMPTVLGNVRFREQRGKHLLGESISDFDPERTSAALTCSEKRLALAACRGAAMKRREFFKLVGGMAASWPLRARAQQREGLRRVVVLEPVAKDTPSAQARYMAFLQAFERLGWMDGRNVQIVAR